eukprot:2153636-Rhodomonas_salina.2
MLLRVRHSTVLSSREATMLRVCHVSLATGTAALRQRLLVMAAPASSQLSPLCPVRFDACRRRASALPSQPEARHAAKFVVSLGVGTVFVCNEGNKSSGRAACYSPSRTSCPISSRMNFSTPSPPLLNVVQGDKLRASASQFMHVELIHASETEFLNLKPETWGSSSQWRFSMSHCTTGMGHSASSSDRSLRKISSSSSRHILRQQFLDE